jgi:predicted O-linked N-acetylglucosamine transferase (SPINDLY family)
VAADAESVEAWLHLARVVGAQHDDRSAVAHVEELASLPHHARCAAPLLALAQWFADRSEGSGSDVSLRFARLAFERAPADVRCLRALATIHSQRREPAEVARLLGAHPLATASDPLLARLCASALRELGEIRTIRAGLVGRLRASPVEEVRRLAAEVEYEVYGGPPAAKDALVPRRPERAGGLIRSEVVARENYRLGLSWQAGGYDAQAEAFFQRAIALWPRLTPARLALARARLKYRRLDEALAVCAGALEVDAGSAPAHALRGQILEELGLASEAVSSYRRALELQPDDAAVHSNLVFLLPFVPNETSSSIAAEAARWAQAHVASIAPARGHQNDRDPRRPLRIGYVSPDFRRHVLAFFLIPLLRAHDRSRFEFYCYSTGHRADEITEEVRAASTVFRDVSLLRDSDLVETIRADRVDVLVDLTMHMGNNRLSALAAKPAPVQVTWFAYPGTTGLAAIDYRFTDPYLDPPEASVEGAYAEASVRLPDTFWCVTESVPGTKAPSPGPLPLATEGKVTFGCLGHFRKTNADVFRLWARVLRAVEGSRFLLLAPEGKARARVRDAFARERVDPKRILFVERQSWGRYLSEYERIDICLDTFPYGGHTTCLDAFWMGVPVVMLSGTTVVGRSGATFAHNLGLRELLARDPGEYVRIAVDLARDVPRLTQLRAELRDRIERSPLMDSARFARNIEAAYRWTWEQWCRRGDGP